MHRTSNQLLKLIVKHKKKKKLMKNNLLLVPQLRLNILFNLSAKKKINVHRKNVFKVLIILSINLLKLSKFKIVMKKN